jgi:hypothetical protein
MKIIENEELEILCGSAPSSPSEVELKMASESKKSRTRRYWIGQGTFSDISRDETVKRIERSFYWAEQFSNTKFVRVEKEKNALNKIYFSSAKRVGEIVGDGKSYFAVQWPSNSWHFNRELKVSHRRLHIVEGVNLHEFGHSLGFKHTNGDKDLMHSFVKGLYPTPKEIIKFQKKLGKSSNFWPIPQQLIGDSIRETTEKRDALISKRKVLQNERQQSSNKERKAVINEIIRSELNPEIQILNDEINRLSVDWNLIKEEYKKVPGAK